MKTHEAVAENRIRFAQRLNEMSEELATLSKEVEKNRKQVNIIPIPHGDVTDRNINRRKISLVATKEPFKRQRVAWIKPKRKSTSPLKN